METSLTSQAISPKKYIDLNNVIYTLIQRQPILIYSKILEIQNYLDSLKKWVEHFRVAEKRSQKVTECIMQGIDSEVLQICKNQNEIEFYFEKYLKTIKPVINNFSSLISSLNPEQFGFYSSSLSKRQVAQLIQIFKPIRNFQILNKQKTLLGLELLTLDQVSQSNVYFFKKVIRKGVPIYKMNLEIPPQNDEIRFWASTMPIKSFIIIGTVTKGKGLGRQSLGMPTANIKINPELNESLSQYPNGIYITTVKIKGKSEIYVGASSLGTNPHYQNSTSKRILQTYIVHDFQDQSLYGQELITQFHELIRLQFKFNDFSAFLNGMRNDIEIAKTWGISHQLLKQ